MTSKQKRNLTILAIGAIAIYLLTRKPKSGQEGNQQPTTDPVQNQPQTGQPGEIPALATPPVVSPITKEVKPGTEVAVQVVSDQQYVKPVVTQWGDFAMPGKVDEPAPVYGLPGQPSYVQDGMKTAFATVQSVQMYQ